MASDVSHQYLCEVLHVLHPPDRWIFVTNLRTSTGYMQGESVKRPDNLRFLDAFAIALWPSLHFKRVAYEVKTSRADLLAELANPMKRAQAMFLSDEFWFAIPAGIFEMRDLPPDAYNCGVLEYNGEKWKKRWTGHGPSPAWPMPEWFVASLLRKLRDSRLKVGVVDQTAMWEGRE